MMNYLNLYVIKIFSLLFLLNAISASARIDEVLQVANNFIEVKEKNVSITNYILDTQNEIDNFYTGFFHNNDGQSLWSYQNIYDNN